MKQYAVTVDKLSLPNGGEAVERGAVITEAQLTTDDGKGKDTTEATIKRLVEVGAISEDTNAPATITATGSTPNVEVDPLAFVRQAVTRGMVLTRSTLSEDENAYLDRVIDGTEPHPAFNEEELGTLTNDELEKAITANGGTLPKQRTKVKLLEALSDAMGASVSNLIVDESADPQNPFPNDPATKGTTDGTRELTGGQGTGGDGGNTADPNGGATGGTGTSGA